MAGEITVYLRTSISIKVKYFSPEGATKATDFLCSSILVVFITYNFIIYTLCVFSCITLRNVTNLNEDFKQNS